MARTVADDMQLAIGAAAVVGAVEDFARNRYLRRLSFSADDLQVELDFSPVEIETDRLGRAVGCAPAEWTASVHGARNLGGDQWAMEAGDAYRLRARNTGERRAFVALLDLLPRGAITVLRPREDEAGSSYEVEPGRDIDLGCYQLADETGLEVLKLFATREPQDFRAMFETRGTRSGGGDLTLLESVVASSYSSTRSSEIGQPEGAATTRSIFVRISPNQF